jgi:hypothetical protein
MMMSRYVLNVQLNLQKYNTMTLNTESVEKLGKVWDSVDPHKKLSDDEERYIELMNEESITFEERIFCQEFEAKMHTRS